MLKEQVGQVWIDYPTAERYSGLSHTTLWRRVASGDIRAAKIGRSVELNRLVHTPVTLPSVTYGFDDMCYATWAGF